MPPCVTSAGRQIGWQCPRVLGHAIPLPFPCFDGVAVSASRLPCPRTKPREGSRVGNSVATLPSQRPTQSVDPVFVGRHHPSRPCRDGRCRVPPPPPFVRPLAATFPPPPLGGRWGYLLSLVAVEVNLSVSFVASVGRGCPPSPPPCGHWPRRSPPPPFGGRWGLPFSGLVVSSF